MFFRKSQPRTVRVIGGKVLKCIICGNDKFRKRRAQLNTFGATFFGLDWLDRSATCYVCSRCRQVHWFA